MSRHIDRKIIVDEPLGYGTADCIDCGQRGERRLPARFPHICHACLFPPPQPEEPDADPPAFLPVVHLIETLLNRTDLVIGSIYKGERRID